MFLKLVEATLTRHSLLLFSLNSAIYQLDPILLKKKSKTGEKERPEQRALRERERERLPRVWSKARKINRKRADSRRKEEKERGNLFVFFGYLKTG